MKQYRFIRYLGRQIDAVSVDIEDVLEEVETTNGGNSTGWSTTNDAATRMQRELPRRIADRLHGRTKDGVEFFAKALTNQASSDGDAASGADLAIVFEVDLPVYNGTTAVLGRTTPLLPETEGDDAPNQDLPTAAETMLARTTDAFLFVFPVDGGVTVVPASAITAYTEAGTPVPATFPDDVYGKRLGRFVEEVAEGFIGDQTLVPGTSDAANWESQRHRLLETMKDWELASLLYIRVHQSDRDARLDEF